MDDLEARAQAGDAAALIALGERAESRGDNPMARGCYARAAKTGRSDALRKLAINLLTRTPYAVEHGIGMIRQAAEQGDAEAMHLCAVLAADDAMLDNRWNVARNYLVRAAERGHVLSQAQLKLLPLDKENLASWLAPSPARVLSESPKVSAFDGFLPGALCDWIVARAKPRIEPATVHVPLTGEGRRMDQIRTNSQAGFHVSDCDVVMMLVKTRMAAAGAIAAEGFEPPMVLHYAIGEEYKPHFDFFDLTAPGQAQEVARAGQRVATFLIYLNDEFDGGETAFPRLDIRFRGKKGDALLFSNVDAAGKPDPKTLHAGVAPSRGEKWLLSQWIRGAASAG